MIKEMRELSVKDMVTIGVFSAICIILIMIGGVPFGINPLFTFALPLGCALLPGPVFLLMIAKTHKTGAITILGVLVGILLLVTGMHWTMGIGYMIYGVIADYIASIGKYKKVNLNILAYMIFSLGATGPYINFFVAQKSYMNYMLNHGTDPVYLDAMGSAGVMWMLPGLILGTLLIAFLSGLIGKKLLKKQFEKAGITG